MFTKIINQMLPTEYLRDKLHHMHYIKINGQLKHNHPKEKFSFILYLNDADEDILLEPTQINNSSIRKDIYGWAFITMQKNHIPKEILVGGI